MSQKGKQIFWDYQVEPLQKKIQKLQRELLRSKIQAAAARGGSIDPEVVAIRGLERFEEEWADWQDGDIEQLSKTQIEFFVNETRRQAPHLFGEGGQKAPAGREPKAQSKEDFKTEKEEADFMVKHGAEVYNSLPGKSRFLGQYINP